MCVSAQVRLRTLTILEPTATPKLRVSLSLTETVTAVTCSVKKVVLSYVYLVGSSGGNLPAALPTMGRRMTPTNSLEM